MSQAGKRSKQTKVKSWPARYGRWLRRRKVLGSLLTAFVLAAVTALGTVAGTSIAESIKDDYKITVEDNPDNISSRTGPRGGAYIVPAPIEDVGDPPNMTNSCVGRYEWARDQQGIDADTTVIRLTVGAEGDHKIRVTGFEPKVITRDSPAIGTHLNCPGRGEQPELRSVGVDLDADPPTTSVTDAQGLPIPTIFDVSGDDQETFEVTANTVTCDCSWVLDVHLLVDGEERTETVHASNGKPFHTSSSTNARSYRFIDGAWQPEDEAGGNGLPGSEPQPPTPVSPCDLLDTPAVAGLLQQGVTPEPTGPVTSPGLSEALLTETRCSWTGTNTSAGGSQGSGAALDSVEVVLAQFNDDERAATELDAEVPMFPGVVVTTFAGADQAFAGEGTAIARLGSLLVRVSVIYDSTQSPSISERLINDVLNRL